MQTFMPFPSFRDSLDALDDKRLGKQRVETFQIIRALTDPDYGWQHHPAVKMWRGHEYRLALYGLESCVLWRSRGHDDSLRDKFIDLCLDLPWSNYPWWWGVEEFHLSHQSNLIRKDADHYGHQFPGVPPDLPYWWPTHHAPAEAVAA